MSLLETIWLMAQQSPAAPPMPSNPGEAVLMYGGWAGFILVILGWLTDKLLPALKDNFKYGAQRRKQDEERMLAPYLRQNEELKKEMADLRAQQRKLIDDHIECEQKHAVLLGTVQAMRSELDMLRRQVMPNAVIEPDPTRPSKPRT